MTYNLIPELMIYTFNTVCRRLDIGNCVVLPFWMVKDASFTARHVIAVYGDRLTVNYLTLNVDNVRIRFTGGAFIESPSREDAYIIVNEAETVFIHLPLSPDGPTPVTGRLANVIPNQYSLRIYRIEDPNPTPPHGRLIEIDGRLGFALEGVGEWYFIESKPYAFLFPKLDYIREVYNERTYAVALDVGASIEATTRLRNP